MGKIAFSPRQVRDNILKRVGAVDKEGYQETVLYLMNEAIIEIVAIHEWECLSKKTILTYSGNLGTGVFEMPVDFDRVILFKEDNTSRLPLVRMTNEEFERYKVTHDVTYPAVYTQYTLDQDSSSIHPDEQVEVYKTPTVGDNFILRYIRTIDEITSSDLDRIPNVPQFLWRAISKMTEVKVLENEEKPSSIIEREIAMLQITIDQAKSRDTRGAKKPRAFVQDPKVSAWKLRRKGL